MSLKRESVPLSRTVGALALGAMALCLTTASIVAAQGPAPVQLGSAGTFAVLSKTGVTDVYASADHRKRRRQPDYRRLHPSDMRRSDGDDLQRGCRRSCPVRED